MFNVFFVDDEAAMRAGIRNIMNWETSGFSLAGEAPDGEIALSLMQDIKPDILITDVKMPFMDGIELARITKQTMPWIKIIILSGFNEFEYARQAISIGVEEYLLKPVTSVELFETLNRVAAKIEADTEKQRIDRERILSMRDISVGGLIPNTEVDSLPTINKLRFVSKNDIPEFLNDYLKKFDKNVIQSLIFMDYMYIDILTLASKIIEEHNGDPRLILSEYSDASALINASSDIKKVQEISASILERAIEFRDTVTGANYNNAVHKAQDYIHKNYQKPNITLHLVAKEVNISPNYFSMLFSQETGETFISYITRTRLEQAKVLLKTTKMRTADIAYSVGYNDTRYFSYVFKRNVGMTPKEFRNA